MTCQPDDPATMCAERRKAQQRGEFYFESSPPHIGWKFRAEPTVEYQVPPRHSFTWCPYCGGDLPDAATILRNIWRETGDGPE